ncbi:MAG: aldose 1-epimerase [Betaproteobacteria bacterium]
MDSLITLLSGRFTAGVIPQLGGALGWFGPADNVGVDFVRPASARAWGEQNVRLTSSYPLVPYSNRIGDGRFRFEGVDYSLRPNAAISEHPLHGIGWLRPWTVTSATRERVALSITHACRGADDSEWPWTFAATQTIALSDTALQITLSITNHDSRAMPAGIGMHPFFPKSPRMRLQTSCAGVWLNDARMLPRARSAVPAEWNFGTEREVADLTVDNCFAGWGRSALLTWPERQWALRLEASEAFGHLIVFTSPGRDSVAIEPVSHANNAVNLAATRDDTGLVVLALGATLSGSFTMTPLALEKADDA